MRSCADASATGRSSAKLRRSPLTEYCRAGMSRSGRRRFTYVIGVKAASHVALTTTHPDAAAILPACLDPNDLAESQAVGEFLQTHNIQAVVFPQRFQASAAGISWSFATLYPSRSSSSSIENRS